MGKLVLIGGSSFSGKTTAIEELCKNNRNYIFIDYRPKPKSQIERFIKFLSYLNLAEKLASISNAVILMDRSPLDYYIWQNITNGIPINSSFVDKYKFNTILVYKEIDVKKVAKERNLDINYLKEVQKQYYHYYKYIELGRKIYLDKDSYLTAEILKQII